MSAQRPECVYCGDEVDPRSAGTFRRVAGWVEYRHNVGGAHSIHLSEDMGEFAHKVCIDERKLRVRYEQPNLFT